MKKHILLLLFMGLFTIFISSCKKYLDKAPISTFTPDEVFANFANLHLYFDAVYNGWLPGGSGVQQQDNNNLHVSYVIFLSGGSRKFSIDQCTDQTVGGRIREDQPIRLGNMGTNLSMFYDCATNQRPMLETSMQIIRICNNALQKVDLVKDAPTQEDIYDLKAQIFFVRAYAHYMFFRFWGPMPYIDHIIGPYDNWDLPRLSKYETCKRICDDFDTAYVYFQKAGMMRRDNPVPGGAGHLNSPEQFKPAGAAAKAFKSRMLLYAASPLNNAHGVSDWQDAAIASWDAIQSAETNGYFLLDSANYKQNFYGNNYNDEAIWGCSESAQGNFDYNNQMLGYLYPGFYCNNTGWCADNPTQATIDKFETKWGDPLNTQADRDAATALGHYNEQNPYVNRDPRFYADILYNQAPVQGYGTAQIWWQNVGGTIVYSDLLKKPNEGITYTGTFQRKFWAGQSVNYNIAPIYTEPIIRLAELYLNYAEAANEAYGPNTPAPGAAITAVQAINWIRTRMKLPPVLPAYTGSTAVFRDRIKNERTVELCFENHYWFDERRWMDAPVNMGTVNMGVDIEKLAAGYDPLVYPTGYRYTRKVVQADHQTAWKDAMYYFPFYPQDYYKMKNFDMSINPYW